MVKTQWVITLERSRDFSGVMIPPHVRTRSTVTVSVSPFTPEGKVLKELKARGQYRPALDRVLALKQREVVVR